MNWCSSLSIMWVWSSLSSVRRWTLSGSSLASPEYWKKFRLFELTKLFLSSLRQGIQKNLIVMDRLLKEVVPSLMVKIENGSYVCPLYTGFRVVFIGGQVLL